jgi:alkylhydroperoxidase family enzyme
MGILRLDTVRGLAGALLLAAAFASPSRGDEEASTTPKIVPSTRPEMKSALEALKRRQPRLPLPAPAADEARSVNNGRMRQAYLPKEWSSFGNRGGQGGGQSASAGQGGGAAPAGGGRERFPGDRPGLVDSTFKVWLFWIASRANNCHYCMGHQELKLARAGMNDDEIAALDGDWSGFPPEKRTAMELARKMTSAPHAITDADVDALRPHYSPEQILEIVQTVAGYNSTNRWTDSLGIPQDDHFGERPTTLETPTSSKYSALVSQVAPLLPQKRAPLENREQVEAMFAKARARKARLPLADDAAVAKAAPQESAPYENWVRLFSAGGRGPGSVRTVAETGRISPLLKAQLAWCSARENRAWYAVDHARRRLAALGVDDDGAFAIDEAGEKFTPAERAAFAFARKLTATPYLIADADIAGLRKLYPDAEVAEIVYVVCQANMFDRFTETAGLPLD